MFPESKAALEAKRTWLTVCFSQHGAQFQTAAPPGTLCPISPTQSMYLGSKGTWQSLPWSPGLPHNAVM